MQSARARAATGSAHVVVALQARVISALRTKGFVVYESVYEADAQMAILLNEGHVDGVLSSDQDLIVLTTRGLLVTSFNFDWNYGDCKALQQSSALTKSLPENIGHRIQKLTCYQSFYMKALYAVLAGCDYISIDGVGPVTALHVVEAILSESEGPLHEPDANLGLNLAVAAVEELQKKSSSWCITTSFADDETVDGARLTKCLRLAMTAFELQPAYSPDLQRIIPCHGPPDRLITPEEAHYLGFKSYAELSARFPHVAVSFPPITANVDAFGFCEFGTRRSLLGVDALMTCKAVHRVLELDKKVAEHILQRNLDVIKGYMDFKDLDNVQKMATALCAFIVRTENDTDVEQNCRLGDDDASNSFKVQLHPPPASSYEYWLRQVFRLQYRPEPYTLQEVTPLGRPLPQLRANRVGLDTSETSSSSSTSFSNSSSSSSSNFDVQSPVSLQMSSYFSFASPLAPASAASVSSSSSAFLASSSSSSPSSFSASTAQQSSSSPAPSRSMSASEAAATPSLTPTATPGGGRTPSSGRRRLTDIEKHTRKVQKLASVIDKCQQECHRRDRETVTSISQKIVSSEVREAASEDFIELDWHLDKTAIDHLAPSISLLDLLAFCEANGTQLHGKAGRKAHVEVQNANFVPPRTKIFLGKGFIADRKKIGCFVMTSATSYAKREKHRTTVWFEYEVVAEATASALASTHSEEEVRSLRIPKITKIFQPMCPCKAGQCDCCWHILKLLYFMLYRPRFGIRTPTMARCRWHHPTRRGMSVVGNMPVAPIHAYTRDSITSADMRHSPSVDPGIAARGGRGAFGPSEGIDISGATWDAAVTALAPSLLSSLKAYFGKAAAIATWLAPEEVVRENASRNYRRLREKKERLVSTSLKMGVSAARMEDRRESSSNAAHALRASNWKNEHPELHAPERAPAVTVMKPRFQHFPNEVVLAQGAPDIYSDDPRRKFYCKWCNSLANTGQHFADDGRCNRWDCVPPSERRTRWEESRSHLGGCNIPNVGESWNGTNNISQKKRGRTQRSSSSAPDDEDLEEEEDITPPPSKKQSIDEEENDREETGLVDNAGEEDAEDFSDVFDFDVVGARAADEEGGPSEEGAEESEPGVEDAANGRFIGNFHSIDFS